MQKTFVLFNLDHGLQCTQAIKFNSSFYGILFVVIMVIPYHVINFFILTYQSSLIV